MKIGILTLPFNNNYGGFLQEYALMTILKRMGHDVWFIDLQIGYNRQSVLGKHLSFFKRLIKKYILRRNVSLFVGKELRQNELNDIIVWQYTRPFVDKYLCPKLSPVYSSEELRYLTERLSFDAFIVGSDQIWRPKFMGKFLKTTYLDFLGAGKEKRISYAASFGVDEWEYTPELTKECAELIKKFDAVSVREDSGVKMCKEYLNVDAQWVLDPTMLLQKEDYAYLINKAKIEQSPGDLFCYILDETTAKQTLIETTAKQLNLTPFYMGRKNNGANIHDKILEPVETWLRGFYDAKFIITDSFHGMVFSIIFNKHFLCIVNEKRGLARFKSLLEILGLSKCLIFNLSEFSVANINSIDWKIVNQILIEKKKDAMDYLLTNLI